MMGVYGIKLEEFEPLFTDFLKELEGNLSSGVVAQAWNHLAKENFWHDRLVSITLDVNEVKADHGSFKKLKKFLADYLSGRLDSGGLHTVLEDDTLRRNLLLLCALCEGLYKDE